MGWLIPFTKDKTVIRVGVRFGDYSHPTSRSDWVSDDSRVLVFLLSLLSVRISDETLPLVFGYRIKHCFSCLIFYLSVKI